MLPTGVHVDTNVLGRIRNICEGPKKLALSLNLATLLLRGFPSEIIQDPD